MERQNDFIISTEENKTKALVIGAGIAGLLAAGALSEHYDLVEIVERDNLPEAPELRAGVPQTFHLHRLATRAQSTLDRLLPNFMNELLANGALTTRARKTQAYNQYGQFGGIFPVEYAASSRALQEWTIRQRIQALSNVQFLTGLDVTGLEGDEGKKNVTGVRVRQRGNVASEHHLSADFVVDTSGRFRKTVSWLEALGRTVPKPDRLISRMGYGTRYYRITDPAFAEEMYGLVLFGNPEAQQRFFYSVVVQGGILQTILFGAGGQYPATDDKDFDEQVRQLLTPEIAATLEKVAEPLGSPRGYRIETCLRHHFEQMEDWPTGLLVMGDALCDLDPIYGHGMTVAAMEAEALKQHLRQEKRIPDDQFERRMMLEFQAAIQPGWWINAITDLRWPGVDYNGQEQLEGVALLHRYIDLYMEEGTKRAENLPDFDPSNPPPPPDIFSPEPSFNTYMMMVGLDISPNVVFNPRTYRLLLDLEAQQEGPNTLRELTDAFGLSITEILDKILPTFTLSFLQPV